MSDICNGDDCKKEPDFWVTFNDEETLGYCAKCTGNLFNEIPDEIYEIIKI